MASVLTLSASRLNFGVSPALARPSNKDSCTEHALLSASQTETSPGSTRRRIGPDRINGSSTANLVLSPIEPIRGALLWCVTGRPYQQGPAVSTRKMLVNSEGRKNTRLAREKRDLYNM